MNSTIMNNFVTIIKSNYNKVIVEKHNFAYKKTLHNILFINDIKQEISLGNISKNNYKSPKEFSKKILSNPKYYNKLQQILLNELITDTDLSNLFNTMTSFAPINKKTPTAHNNYTTIVSPVLNSKSQLTSYNEGMALFLEYINTCTFMSYDVFDNIDTKYTDLKQYTGNYNIKNIYMLSNNNQTNINPNVLPFLSKIAQITIDSLSQLLKINPEKEFDIIFYANNSKKQFPEIKNTPITETNTNSGDTIKKIGDLPRSMIRLYRSEEIIKVLIHEIIHATNFDSKFRDTINHHFKVFNLNMSSNELLISETLVETLAEFINCALYSIIHNQNLDDILKKEIDHGFRQTAKILNHFNFDSLDDFLLNDNNKIIKQKTAVFEYHILKSVLLYKFDEFISMITNKNNINAIIKFAENTMKNDENYINKINQYMHNINQDKSFRMSITEIYTLENIPQMMYGGSMDYYSKYLQYRKEYLELKKLIL